MPIGCLKEDDMDGYIFSNGNSFTMDDAQLMTLPWMFRVLCPSLQCGWRPC